MPIISPVIRSVIQPVIRPVGGFVGGSPAFDPASLFAGGKQGFVLDPTNSATRWTTAAGSTPAVATDPVGRLDDTSGNGNNATATDRPTLTLDGSNLVLGYNGSSNFMQTAAIDLSASSTVTIIQAIKVTSTALYVGVETSVNLNSNTGAVLFYTDSGRAWLGAAGSSNTVGQSAFSVDPDIQYVVTCRLDFAATTYDEAFSIRINGVDVPLESPSGVLPMGGNLGNYAAYLGARAGTASFLSGTMGPTMLINDWLTGAALDNSEAWVSSRVGL